MMSPTRKSMRERLLGFWQYVPGGTLVFAVIPLLVLSYFGWFYYGAKHLDHALYSVSPDQISMTPQPPWIQSDVLKEVFSKARLERISLLDPKANASIAQAFEAHAWIRSATRVTKAAGGKVVVDVVYRRPLAMVYCEPAKQDESAAGRVLKWPGFFPVDADAVMLPVGDFSEAQIWEYFLILADGASPAGDIGMAFGDVRISEALGLCAFLGAERQSLRLERVYVDHDHRSSGASPWVLTLETTDKHQIRWGHRPAAEGVGESSALEKLKTMTVWLESQRASQAPAGKLDLLSNSAVSSVSRAAP